MTGRNRLSGPTLSVPPGRVLTLRGGCGVANGGVANGGGTGGGGGTSAAPCTLDANSLTRHLHVTPGADVRLFNLRLVGDPGPTDNAKNCSNITGWHLTYSTYLT